MDILQTASAEPITPSPSRQGHENTAVTYALYGLKPAQVAGFPCGELTGGRGRSAVRGCPV